VKNPLPTAALSYDTIDFAGEHIIRVFVLNVRYQMDEESFCDR
jgi:hypothetical protein